MVFKLSPKIYNKIFYLKYSQEVFRDVDEEMTKGGGKSVAKSIVKSAAQIDTSVTVDLSDQFDLSHKVLNTNDVIKVSTVFGEVVKLGKSFLCCS